MKLCFQKGSFAEDIAKTVVIANLTMTDGFTATIIKRAYNLGIGMSAVNNSLHITEECSAAILSTIAALPPETGGILGSKDGNVVTDFIFDKGKENTSEFYIPDVMQLNKGIISWRQEGIRFIGMIHSHLRGRNKLSTSDIEYANKIMKSMNMERLYMMLVDTNTIEYDVTAFEFFNSKELKFKRIACSVI